MSSSDFGHFPLNLLGKLCPVFCTRVFSCEKNCFILPSKFNSTAPSFISLYVGVWKPPEASGSEMSGFWTLAENVSYEKWLEKSVEISGNLGVRFLTIYSGCLKSGRPKYRSVQNPDWLQWNFGTRLHHFQKKITKWSSLDQISDIFGCLESGRWLVQNRD